MIDRSHDLPIRRQAELVNISRGSAYYKARPVSEGDLELMRRVDELHLELPFAGARMLRDLLRGEGVAVGRKHMTTLMRRMAITALYRCVFRRNVTGVFGIVTDGFGNVTGNFGDVTTGFSGVYPRRPNRPDVRC